MHVNHGTSFILQLLTILEARWILIWQNCCRRGRSLRKFLILITSAKQLCLRVCVAGILVRRRLTTKAFTFQWWCLHFHEILLRVSYCSADFWVQFLSHSRTFGWDLCTCSPLSPWIELAQRKGTKETMKCFGRQTSPLIITIHHH